MNLIFGHIKASNFMSFKELDFDFSSFKGQNVLIYGVNDDIKGESTRSNGSGKSTLMNALIFALYGDILNPIKMSHIRNWKSSAKEDVDVELSLQSNGVNYIIKRLLHGKKCDQELHVYSSADDKEWSEITLSTIAETQRMIENDIVLCGKEGFLRCVLLTADQNYNFFKLSKSAKNQFFESLFELTTYSDMYARLHRRTLDENTQITIASRTIDNLNANITKLEAQREEERRNCSELKKAEDALTKAKNALSEFISHTDVDAELRQIDDDIVHGRDEMNRRINEDMSKYDAEHGITKVDSLGNIRFNPKEEMSAIEDALAAFDRKHGITVDENGNIDFSGDTEYSSLVEQEKTIKSRIDKGETMTSDVEDKIRALKNGISTSRNDISCAESQIDAINAMIKTHASITDVLCDKCISKYKKTVKIDDSESKIAKFLEKIEETNAKIAEYESKASKDEKILEKYRAGISRLEESLMAIREAIAEKDAFRKTIRNEREMHRKNAINNTHMKQKERQIERNRHKSEISNRLLEERLTIERELRTKRDALTKKSSELRKSVSDAEYRCKLLSESALKNFDTPINSLKESLESTKAEFDAHNATIAHCKALEEILKPDNIRKSVVSDMLKELNFRICGYLAKMGSNYTCRFDEDFDATFMSSAGIETEYNNFSSGEKMRLGIACCLAFRDFMQVRLNLHPNILAIDEYIDSNLDPMAVNGIMDMIHYMVGTEKIAAFIISHRSEVMQDMFDSEIMIRKKDNESKIYLNGQSI